MSRAKRSARLGAGILMPMSLVLAGVVVTLAVIVGWILQVEWIFSGASIFWMLVSVAAMLGGLVIAVWIAAASRGGHPAARSGSRHAWEVYAGAGRLADRPS